MFKEPVVIDDELLQAAVDEQGPKEYAGEIARAEGIEFFTLLHLRLDFRSKDDFRDTQIISLSIICKPRREFFIFLLFR